MSRGKGEEGGGRSLSGGHARALLAGRKPRASSALSHRCSSEPRSVDGGRGRTRNNDGQSCGWRVDAEQDSLPAAVRISRMAGGAWRLGVPRGGWLPEVESLTAGPVAAVALERSWEGCTRGSGGAARRSLLLARWEA
jgi:hypothetical protein